MRAMVFTGSDSRLQPVERDLPARGEGEVLIRVHACGVCRTDLHVVDGELSQPRLPLVPGHQIVGTVVQADAGSEFEAGSRVGVPWLGWTCGECRFCKSGQENLCDRARFTGYQIDGGFADYTVASERFCFALPQAASDLEVAPLLCAGLIGYRALAMTGDPHLLGLYGFGASAHIVCQLARFQGRRVFAFTRAGDTRAQAFARELGAEWAGDALAPSPEPLDASIIFAPVGELVPAALSQVAKGGTVVCAGIHMSDIPSFGYDLLWGERVLRSVANLTRRDGAESMELAAKAGVRTHIQPFPLEQTNYALDSLRSGSIQGQAVVVVDEGRS
jgi:alcohol dehydrogenase, propanol-preferring